MTPHHLRRRLGTLAFAVCASIFAQTLVPQSLHAQPSERPNIVLIMADDFGYECVTANGGDSYPTPHLDRLAREGVRFSQCHVQPLCTPTRVQLMTGLYNIRNYVKFGTLPRSEKTFAHFLQQAGYATAICGKWQLGNEVDSPRHFGFDESCLWQHTRRPPRYANPGLEYGGDEKDFSNGEYGPELVNDFALDFMTRHRDQSFLLYYPMILTHDPFQPTPDSENWDPSAKGEQVHRNTKHFADMTVYMDQMIGRVDEKLAELGIRENTLLIFLGDNGTHSSITSQFNAIDYQGGKGSTTAHGTHVPLIANWPGRVQQSAVSDALISSVDFLPTLCEVAGVSPPQRCDGLSFLAQLEGRTDAKQRDWLYCWYSPRQRNDLSVQEFAFDANYKLYRDGRLINLRSDRLEKTPIDADRATTDDKLAQEKLNRVLDQFTQARPRELDEAVAGKLPPKKPKKKSATGN